MSGLFITLEGGEGAGKSSIITALKEHFQNNASIQKPIVFTREPGSSSIGRTVRETILGLDGSEILLSPKAEALLFAADRAQHMEEIIFPTLEKNGIVICDRFIDSSYAYQGIARELGGFVKELSLWAISERVPDLTILIDIDPKVGIERKNTQKELNKMEQESLEFHQTVREAFLKLAAEEKTRFVVINGEEPLDKIINQVISKIESML